MSSPVLPSTMPAFFLGGPRDGAYGNLTLDAQGMPPVAISIPYPLTPNLNSVHRYELDGFDYDDVDGEVESARYRYVR